MTLPEGITQDELNRYARLSHAVRKANEELAVLNAKIKDAYPNLGTFVAAPVIIKRSQSVGVDVAAVAAAYPYEAAPEYYSAAVDLRKLPVEVKDTFPKITQRLSVDVISDAPAG